jgi:hypothetical protein
MTRIQRMPFPVVQATLANLCTIYLLKDIDDPDNKPTAPEPLKKIENAVLLSKICMLMCGRCPLM